VTGLSVRDRVLAVAALVGAAILVGMAAHPGSGSGVAAIPPEPFMVLGQTAVWLLIAADVLVTAGIVYALFSKPVGLNAPPRKRHWATHLLALVPTMFAAVMILWLHPVGGRRGLLFLPALTGVPPSRLPPTSKLLGSAPTHDLTWLSIVLAGLIVMVFLGWLFWPVTRRKPVIKPPAPIAAESVVDALDESLDALLAIPDPRRAIIAAYSFMERSMERVGLPRQRHEAPMEFMARVLESLMGLSSDVTQLTHLFEIAKFSHHEIDEEMRSDAVLALSRIRVQLVASSPS
jgi:hypothetical protein